MIAGLSLRQDGGALDPHLPATWRRAIFRAHWRGRRLQVRLDADGTLAATLERGTAMTLHVGGHPYAIDAGETVGAAWRGGARSAPPLDDSA